MPPKKRKALTLQQKYKIICDRNQNPHTTNESLAAKYDCGKTTISDILGKQKNKIVELRLMLNLFPPENTLS